MQSKLRGFTSICNYSIQFPIIEKIFADSAKSENNSCCRQNVEKTVMDGIESYGGCPSIGRRFGDCGSPDDPRFFKIITIIFLVGLNPTVHIPHVHIQK